MSDLATEVYRDIQFGIKTPLEAFRILKTVDMNNIKLTNQDLVGFFTSVPQERILDGVHRTIQLYCIRSGATMHDSFRANTDKVPQQTIKTNLKQMHKMVMNLHQLQVLAKWVVENGYFQVQHRVIHQILGAPIGNPISPVLCSLAILHQEIQWHAEHDSPYKYIKPFPHSKSKSD